MKRTTRLATLISTGLLAASPAFADFWGAGNADAYGTILNDLDKPAYVGTSMAEAKTQIDIYPGFVGNLDLDRSGFAVGTGHPGGYGPWGHGNQDGYGTVLSSQ